MHEHSKGDEAGTTDNRNSQRPAQVVAFDVLSVDSRVLDHQPYRDRRRRLEALDRRSPHVHVTSSHSDGVALWDSVVGEGLEGVVPKRVDEPYRPGERRW